jgi:predicted PurR-regulated permease PerM
VFGLFTVALFTFYFSADMPRLQTWMASLFPPRSRGVAVNVWRITAQKTGGYVGARVVLGAINSVTSGIVFAVIGLPYWLPLALWTGVVAQFVPTIGTYIAIILPVLVGVLSPNPWLGLVVLGWALLYQQVENLTIEPKISAKAVDVNPAVGFGAVLLGSALFGIAGAFLAVPVVAMLLSLLEIYGKRYELGDEATDASPPSVAVGADAPAGASTAASSGGVPT